MPPPLPEIEGVEHRWESVNGIRMHYAEAGAGDPLLLVHGWPQHWWMWRDHIGALAERFRVIAPDLRGHGWSDKPDSSYRKAELLDDVLALLDRLGMERVRWVGHDWGAWTGMLAALGAPERIERFVCMSIPHPWQRTRDPRTILAAAAYQSVLAGPGGRLALQRLGFARLILRAGRSAGSFDEAEIAMYDDVMRDADAASASVHLYRSFLLHELRSFATGELAESRLTVPTLWLVGEHDLVARGADRGYRERADDMTLEKLPGAGHFLPEELPQTVRERILAFL